MRYLLFDLISIKLSNGIRKRALLTSERKPHWHLILTLLHVIIISSSTVSCHAKLPQLNAQDANVYVVIVIVEYQVLFIIRKTCTVFHRSHGRHDYLYRVSFNIALVRQGYTSLV